MRIAQIAPPIESVPPQLYGGTERIVSYLTEELVGMGHEVTLFASGDSVTSADLVPCAPKALRLDARVRDPIPYYMLMLDRVYRQADDFDVLHFHIDQFQFPMFQVDGRPDADDGAWAAGPSRPVAALSRVCGDAARLDLGRPAPPGGERQFRCHHSSRHPGEPAPADLRAARRLCGVSRPHLAGEAGRPGDRDRPHAGRAAEDCRQGRQGRSKITFARRSRRCSMEPGSSSSARSMSTPRRNSSAKRARCCFRSIGRSRSGCR